LEGGVDTSGTGFMCGDKLADCGRCCGHDGEASKHDHSKAQLVEAFPIFEFFMTIAEIKIIATQLVIV
jgi:hypothetical protein